MPKKLKIEKVPAAASNYSIGRSDKTVKYVIIHTMQGSLAGTAAWFSNPAAGGSAHYGVGFDGEVHQYVDEKDTAWHSGNRDYNLRSLGIELEGFMERGYFPDTMMDAAAALTADILLRCKLKPTRQVVIGHVEVPSPDGKGFGGKHHHQDPGPKFPWDDFMNKIKRALE